ncbi:primase C-terminal domain-containing protein, partial [Candidatus Bathyarchaeota archaeon]|nr:primase C-terminal domain-containing protein [Candidatus Bathyarchaeota archaeon]
EALKKAGIQPETVGLWFRQTERLKEGYKGPNPPCIKALLEGVEEGLRNEVGIRLASYFLNFKKLSRARALEALQRWNSRNRPPLSSKELESIIKSAELHGYVYGCDDELLKANCKEDKCPLSGGSAKKVVKTASAELPDGRLIEQAYDGHDTYFLVYNPETGQTKQMEQIETEDCIYKPIKSPEVEKGLTLLPSKAEEYGSEEQLLKDIVDFLNRWHEAPNEFERQLDALYILMTYIYDLLPRLPYRRALGAYGRGKTAWLETVGFICYRPLILAGCSTDIAIVRRIDLWRGTALIDEADFTNSGLYAFVVKILNVGYDRNLGFYQRADDINPKKTLFFNVYGPKLLATRREFKDKALESRCLTFIAREKTRDIPLYRNERFKAEAQDLRNKLILWRFRVYHKLKARISQLESSDFEKNLGFNVSSRIKEIVGPLVLLGEKFKPIIEKVALELEAQLASDPEAQLELAFNKALEKIFYNLEIENREGVTCVNGVDGIRGSPLTLENFTSKAKDETTFLHIPLSRIAKIILNDEEPDENQLKSLNQRLAKIIRSHLGFRVFRGSKNRTYVEVPLSYKPLTQVTQVTPKRQVITLKHFDVIRPELTAMQLNMLNQLRAEAERIKQMGVWVIHKGWFVGSLNRKYSREELQAIAQKLPRLSYVEEEKSDRIKAPPSLTLGELIAETSEILSENEGSFLEIEVSPNATKKSFEAELKEILKPESKLMIIKPSWAMWMPPYRHEGLFYTEHVPKDVLVCEEFHLTEPLPTEPLTPQVSIKAFNIESVPGCFEKYGQPIPFWRHGCEKCVWSSKCMEATISKISKNWQKLIQISKLRAYAYLTVNLTHTPIRLTDEGVEKLTKLILNYIQAHWHLKPIRGQFFTVSNGYVSFKIHRDDVNKVSASIIKILKKYTEAGTEKGRRGNCFGSKKG